jgi:transketolase
MERLNRQDAAYQEAVLPSTCSKRIAIEAGVGCLWWKYVGLQGKVVAIDRFGISAPGDVVMRELCMTAENLIAVAQA